MVGSSSYLVAYCLLVPEYFYPDGQYNYRCSYDDCVWNISVDTDRICATPILVPHKNQKLLVTYSSNMLKSNYMSWANHCHLICCRGNTAHYLLHGCHHKHPMDGLRLVFPPAAAAILCFPVNNLPYVLRTRVWVSTVDKFQISTTLMLRLLTSYYICSILHPNPFSSSWFKCPVCTWKSSRFQANQNFL